MATRSCIPDGDPEAAEVNMLTHLAREAALAALQRRDVQHRFHGYAITARRRQKQPDGWAITLTLTRHGQPWVQEAILIPDA
jgi:hypothetical protein